jgi:eukaryotic-like serine/threonine-protein kinase
LATSRTIFGKYQVLEKLGSGGMATAYRAELAGAAGVKKRLVLKVIHPHLAQKKSFVEMFVAEAKIVASLAHGNLAQVFDFGLYEGQYYIAMEEVIGKPLSKVLKAARDRGFTRLPVPIALQIVIGVLDGLHHAHTRRNEAGEPLKLVHRDATPDNVLISYEGDIKVVDFGIAKTEASEDQTEVGMVRGKYPYMSPEQASGARDLDARSDIWAVGVQLYEMLAGRRPYEGEFRTVMREVVSTDPVPALRTFCPDIEPTLEQLIAPALMKPRDQRPASARDFSLALNSYLHQHYPHSTRQDLQFLLGALFPLDVSKEGADVTVPPAFVELLQKASVVGAATAERASRPGPPVPTEPPQPIATREAPKARPVDIEATVNSLTGADDDEATVAGLPEPKKPATSGERKAADEKKDEKKDDKKPAETLAEILAQYRPAGVRPSTAIPVVDDESTLAGAPLAPTDPIQPRASGPRKAAKSSGPKVKMSREVSLRKDMGEVPRRQSMVIAGFSLVGAALAVTAFWMIRNSHENEVPAPVTAQVWVASSPPGALFKLDGAPSGKTPFSAQVMPGEHTVAVELLGYAPWSRTFSVEPGQVLNLNANLELVGTASLDGGGMLQEPEKPEPAWPVLADELHSVRWPKRFHNLSLKAVALPLAKYKPLKIDLNPKTAYQLSTSGSVSLGRNRSTGTLLYFADMEGRGPGQIGLLGPTPRTIKGAKVIRIFALDEDLSDNSGQLAIVSRISQYIVEKTYGFDAKKHVLVPDPAHQYRIEGMDPKAQYLMFSRVDRPALNKDWRGKASQLLCISHWERHRPLSVSANIIPLGGRITLENIAGLSCFFLDDTTEDNSGSVELDIVDSTQVEQEGVNPKLYLPPGKW